MLRHIQGIAAPSIRKPDSDSPRGGKVNPPPTIVFVAIHQSNHKEFSKADVFALLLLMVILMMAMTMIMMMTTTTMIMMMMMMIDLPDHEGAV